MWNPECWLTSTQGPEPGSDQSLEGFLEEERPGHGDDAMPWPLREMERPGSMSPLGRDLREPAVATSSVRADSFTPTWLTLPSPGASLPPWAWGHTLWKGQAQKWAWARSTSSWVWKASLTCSLGVLGQVTFTSPVLQTPRVKQESPPPRAAEVQMKKYR